MVRARGVSAARDAGLRVGVIGLGWAGQQHIAAYDALPGARGRRASPGWRSRSAAELAREYGIDARGRALGGPAGARRPRRGQRRRAHLPARPDRDRRARARHATCCREKPIALQRAAGATRWSRPRARPTACSTSPSTTASAATSRSSRRSSTPAGSGRPYYAKAWWLRRTGIPTLGSWFTRAELAGGGPLVDIGVHVLDYSLFLLGNPEVVA